MAPVGFQLLFATKCLLVVLCKAQLGPFIFCRYFVGLSFEERIAAPSIQRSAPSIRGAALLSFEHTHVWQRASGKEARATTEVVRKEVDPKDQQGAEGQRDREGVRGVEARRARAQMK